MDREQKRKGIMGGQGGGQMGGQGGGGQMVGIMGGQNMMPQTSVGSMIQNLGMNGLQGGNVDQFMSSPFQGGGMPPPQQPQMQPVDTGSVEYMNNQQQQKINSVLGPQGGNMIDQWKAPPPGYQDYMQKQRELAAAEQARTQTYDDKMAEMLM